MIFNDLAYFVLFLLPSALLFRLVSPSARPWLCTISGSLFFVYFSLTTIGGVPGAICLSLLFWQAFCCVYLCRPGSRVCLLVAAQALLLLGVFKYFNFIGEVVYGSAKASPFYWRDAFLPLGISFFTFEFIHFTLDCYKHKIERVELRDFLAFILFFPTMVAGPIKRFQDFTPKIHQPITDWPTDFNRGITRILYGLAKKFAVADLLTSLTDHLKAQDIQQASGRGILLLWLFAYGIKIYADFSAYSDIAIGSARLLGIRVPENFDWPYMQSNIAEFWKHWHISLYRWLIDYIYIPLGGSRVSSVRVYCNIVLVMLASGIWHGAGLNFVVWGAWHALLLCVHRFWSARQYKVVAFLVLPAKMVSWLLTYVTVNLGWAFFAMPFSTAILFFHKLFLG